MLLTWQINQVQQKHWWLHELMLQTLQRVREYNYHVRAPRDRSASSFPRLCALSLYLPSPTCLSFNNKLHWGSSVCMAQRHFQAIAHVHPSTVHTQTHTCAHMHKPWLSLGFLKNSKQSVLAHFHRRHQGYQWPCHSHGPLSTLSLPLPRCAGVWVHTTDASDRSAESKQPVSLPALGHFSVDGTKCSFHDCFLRWRGLVWGGKGNYRENDDDDDDDGVGEGRSPHTTIQPSGFKPQSALKTSDKNMNQSSFL